MAWRPSRQTSYFTRFVTRTRNEQVEHQATGVVSERKPHFGSRVIGRAGQRSLNTDIRISEAKSGNGSDALRELHATAKQRS